MKRPGGPDGTNYPAKRRRVAGPDPVRGQKRPLADADPLDQPRAKRARTQPVDERPPPQTLGEKLARLGHRGSDDADRDPDPLGLHLERMRSAMIKRAIGKTFRRTTGRAARGNVHEFLMSRSLGNQLRFETADHYGFVHKIEDRPDGLVDVFFECTTTDWMDEAWSDLVDVGAAETLNELLLAGNFRKDFEGSTDKLGYADQRFLWSLYLWFLERLWQDGQEAPVAYWRVSLDRATAEGWALHESAWFKLRLTTLPLGVMAIGEWTPQALDGRDPSPTDRGLVNGGLMRMPSVSGDALSELNFEALLMLHFPKTPPPPPEDGEADGEGELARGPGAEGSEHGRAPDSTWMRVHSGVSELLRRLREGAGRLGDALDRGVGALVGEGMGGWVPALAGGVTGPVSPGEVRRPAGDAHRPDRAQLRPPAAPLAYSGGGTGVPGAAVGDAALPNPMVKGAAPPHDIQPFVADIDIGQGNCNALFDNQGRVIAYYDLGYRKLGDDPIRLKPVLCFCHRPLIILSHWDADHISLARVQPDALRLNWIVPRQHVGTGEARDVIAGVVRMGGRMYVWRNRNGTMTFPWGFLVRADRPVADPALETVKNDTGLGLYVCVKDGPANIVAPNNPVACQALAVGAGATHAAAAGVVHGRMYDTFGTNAKATTAFQQGSLYREVIDALDAAAAQPFEVRGVIAGLIVCLTGRSQARPNQAELVRIAHVVWNHRANAVALPANWGAAVVDAQHLSAAERVCYVIGYRYREHGVYPIDLRACLVQWTPQLKSAAKLSMEFYPDLVTRATHVVPPAAVPLVIEDVDPVQPFPPAHATERFVMSCGDAAPQYLPPQRLGDSPPLVGYFAFHHGSNISDQDVLKPEAVPWAFNSPAARDAAHLHAHAPRIPALQAARAVAVCLGGSAARALVDDFDAELQAGRPEPASAVLVIARKYAPALTQPDATRLFDEAAILAPALASTVADVLTAAGMAAAPTPAQRVAAAAALAWHRTAVGVPVLALQVADLDQDVLRSLEAALPTNGGSKMADDAFDTTVAHVLGDALPAINVAMPNEPRAMAAVLAASTAAVPLGLTVAAATADEQREVVAALNAVVGVRRVVALAPAALGGYAFARENGVTTLALMRAVVASGAAWRITAPHFALNEVMTYAMMVVLASPQHLQRATRASGGGEDAGDRLVLAYGNGPQYGHPMQGALDKYFAHGWTHALEREGRPLADYDFAVGWEVDAAAAYEGPLRGDVGTPGLVDRTVVPGCNCAGVKVFHTT